MPTVKNLAYLPGVYVYKDDGNLRVIENVPGNVTVVLGTAPAGRVGQVYLVRNTSDAIAQFDPDNTMEGTLLEGMYEALESGAEYVALLRIGASPCGVDFVNGHTIVSPLAEENGGSKYKIYYKVTAGVELLKIFDAESGSVVFDSSEGYDSGAVMVFGDMASATSPLALGTDANDPSTCPTFADLEDLSDAQTTASAAITIVPTVGGDNFTSVTKNVFKAGQIIEVGAKYFLVSHVIPQELNDKVILESELEVDVNGNVSVFDPTPSLVAEDVSAKLKVRFIPENLGLDLTPNQLFSQLAKAYYELESANIDYIIPKGTFVDSPNVVDNEGAITLNKTGVFLGKVHEFKHNSQYFHIFKNVFTHATTDVTADEIPTPYEVGLDGVAAEYMLKGIYKYDTFSALTSIPGSEPDADITLSEANYFHQMCEFLYGLSVNQTECHGAMSMVPPKYISRQHIAQWLGELPKVDTDGDIIVSGKGVLGYKFKSGSTRVAPGFFHTANGMVDGVQVLDRNRMPIDIGQYGSVTAMPLIIRTSFAKTASGYRGSAAGIYLGTASALDLKEAPTNKKIKARVDLPFKLKLEELDKLSQLQYVAFTFSPDGSVKIVDAPTSALKGSDYDRFLSVRTTGVVLDLVRSIADPFIGKVTSPELRNALQEEINKTLKQLSADGYLRAGNVTLFATRDMEILGQCAAKLDLITHSELRQLTVFTALKK